jgi:hypothetical protein
VIEKPGKVTPKDRSHCSIIIFFKDKNKINQEERSQKAIFWVKITQRERSQRIWDNFRKVKFTASNLEKMSITIINFFFFFPFRRKL